MSRKVTRRKFMAGTAAGAALATFKFPDAGDRAGRAVQARPAHRQDRTARAGRHPDGTGRRHVPEGKELHLRRPQGRVHLRRHRRQPGRHQDQGAGTDRARQGRRHPRAARRLRTARHHRLHQRAKDADAQPRRRRGHDAAASEPLLPAPVGDLLAGHASDGRLRGQGIEAQEASSPSPRTSPSATSRWAASSRPSRKTAARSSTRSGRRWSRPTTRPSSRRSRIATACARASPARTRCAS